MLAKTRYREFVKLQDDMSGPDRVETGMLQFPGDWPGVFIRGDDAMSLPAAIRKLVEIAVEAAPEKMTDLGLSVARLLALADVIEKQVMVGKLPDRKGYVQNHCATEEL